MVLQVLMVLMVLQVLMVQLVLLVLMEATQQLHVLKMGLTRPLFRSR